MSFTTTIGIDVSIIVETGANFCRFVTRVIKVYNERKKCEKS